MFIRAVWSMFLFFAVETEGVDCFTDDGGSAEAQFSLKLKWRQLDSFFLSYFSPSLNRASDMRREDSHLADWKGRIEGAW